MTLQNLTYKQKKYLLWAGVFLLIVFIYKKQIQSTFLLIGNCRELENSLQRAENADIKLAMLRSEIKRINAASGNLNSSPDQVQQEILDKAAALSQQGNITLSSFNEMHQAVSNGYMVTSHIIEVEGEFIPAVKFIHDFENTYKDARLVSVRFYTKEDYKTHKKYLYGTLCFQHVRKA